MATLTAQSPKRGANSISFSAPSAGGDDFANSGTELLLVQHTNSAGTQKTLTIVTPAVVDGDLSVADRQIVIGPGELHMLGPWPTNTYNDSQGKVSFSFDATNDLQVAVIKP